MLIEYDLEGNKIDKVAGAIELLQKLEPEDGYVVAFSGGKDSQCVAELAKMAGVKHELVYSLTTVDPPELVRFIKEHYPEAWKNQHVEYWPDTGEPITMWNLIPRKRMPPTRLARYCCEVLKETAGMGRVTVTGVRWAESSSRAANQGSVTIVGVGKKDIKKIEQTGADFSTNDRGGVTLNYDNSATKEVIEMCYRRRKTLVNPIVNWTDEDVWEFLNNVAKVPHCELYDKGYERLGCIGCPISYRNAEELERYPVYKRNYIKAFDRMIEKRAKDGLGCVWKSGEEVMTWWLGGNKKVNPLEGQVKMDELIGEEPES